MLNIDKETKTGNELQLPPAVTIKNIIGVTWDIRSEKEQECALSDTDRRKLFSLLHRAEMLITESLSFIDSDAS
ncbi:MAG: hypothetical protein R3C28_33235, partial [Pirellulaceae bacterium]